MKVLDCEAVLKQINKILEDNWKQLKVKPQYFWNRLKWKILGVGALIRAIHHDNEVLMNATLLVEELKKAISEGYYHIEVTLDETGFSPLPCPLCKGEEKLLKESKSLREIDRS